MILKEHPFPPLQFIFDGPSLEGVVFTLKSSDNKPTHTLTITSQTYVSDNYAFIQGTWQGDGGTAKDFTGSLTDGTVSMTCSWANGMSGVNTLIGRITPVSQIVANGWQFTGSVVVTSNGAVVQGGPGGVSGEGRPPQIGALP
jgi:hypothetical protein